MNDYLQALALIFIAEMGDKTQIMAMAFATQYKVKQILIGVAIGAFFNHGLAILLGSMLTQFVPLEARQLVAGVLFITFGLLSLSI
ncbi:MAG TPA: TMEM165/GDT1 family protein, partial [Fusibacter sp.]|nr:TMEM165/GDT1 family protein [Fusibacter sp.]